MSGAAIYANVAAAWLALGAYLGFASRRWRKILEQAGQRLGDWAVLLLLLPYLLATSFRPEPLDLVRLLVYVALPTVLLRLRPRDGRPFDLMHVLVVLCIWVPIEVDLFVLLVDLIVPGVDLQSAFSGVYLLPRADALLVPGVSLPIPKLTAILMTLFLFLVRHPLEGIGFTAAWRWKDLGHALLGLCAFAVVGIPVGMTLGFLQFRLAWPEPFELAARILAGYLLVALPEELLFRGVIQNLLQKRWRRGYLVLPLAAFIFGLAHLNNATPGFAEPNWAYVLMATFAGLAYGWVWRRTKRVTISALTHMLVNLMWSIVFA